MLAAGSVKGGEETLSGLALLLSKLEQAKAPTMAVVALLSAGCPGDRR